MTYPITLTSRLQAAFDMVSISPCLDVGSDHGFLAIDLADKFLKVYASENKIGPYKRLVTNLKIYDNKVTPLFIDGIKDMPLEIKSVIILGMGGDTILKILEEGKNRLNQLDEIIIEPQSAFTKPIRYLYDNNFKNVDSKMIFEKHYYPLLKYQKGEEIIDKSLFDISMMFGSNFLSKKDESFCFYIQKELETLSNLSKMHQLTELNQKRETNLKKILSIYQEKFY